MTVEQVIAIFAGLGIALLGAIVKYVRDFVVQNSDVLLITAQKESIALIENAADTFVKWVEQKYPDLAGNEKFQMVLAKMMEEVPANIDFEPYIEAAVKRMKEIGNGGSN